MMMILLSVLTDTHSTALQCLKAETVLFPGSVLVQPPWGMRRCPDPGSCCSTPMAHVSDNGFWNEISLPA